MYVFPVISNRMILADAAGVHIYTHNAASRLTGVDGVSYTYSHDSLLVGRLAG
jgi:hypothetical protein